MYFWKYKVKGWEENIGEYIDEGLIHGGNFTDAVDNLENFYGNEICSIYIEAVGEENEPYLLNERYKINEDKKCDDDKSNNWADSI